MTTESSKPSGADEICPMCQRPKKVHTQQELESCQRKMREFKESKTGGAGVQ